MGLFSSKKSEPPKTTIPADILADVSVNGEKKVTAPALVVPPTPSETNTPVSTSPFLKSRVENPQSSAPAPVTEAPSAGGAITFTDNPPENTPKPFQFADQNPVSPRVRFPETAAGSDFSRPDFSQITQDKALTERQKEHLAPLKMPKEGAIPTKKTFFSPANLISLVVFILILGFISGGSWYYLNTRTVEEETPEASIDELQNIGENNDSTAEKSISIDQPNYLTLDIETVTSEQIASLLNAEKEKMIQEGVTTPVEYLVVDTNSNPVAFSRFAFLVGANTPEDLVAASLEPFSLYLYLDQGALRMALAVTIRPEVGANFPTNKTILPQALKRFFYPQEYATRDLSTLVFSQSSYKGQTISYTNVDEPANYSFDMINQEGILTLANSKNTLRAVIDKRLLVPEQ